MEPQKWVGLGCATSGKVASQTLCTSAEALMDPKRILCNKESTDIKE